MRINHNIAKQIQAKKEVKTNWQKSFQCGVNFKAPYMSGGKPTSYQNLFSSFVIKIGYKPQGVSGKELREDLGWRDGTHSDYFAMFTNNKIFVYNRKTRLYEKGENFEAYMSYSSMKRKESIVNK